MEKQQEEGKNAVLAARVPLALKKLVTRFLAIDTHLNESDLLRDAIREKILRDAPELYRQLFEEASK